MGSRQKDTRGGQKGGKDWKNKQEDEEEKNEILKRKWKWGGRDYVRESGKRGRKGN